MVEYDYAVPPEITIGYEGDLDLKEFYELLKSWLKNKGFFLLEKEHHGTEDKFKSKIDALRKIDEYTKYVIKVTITSSNLKQISKKDKNSYNGEFKVALESYLEKDYEERYEKKPLLKFFRSVYGKFIERSREEHNEKELKEITTSFYNEIKAYFGLKITSE